MNHFREVKEGFALIPEAIKSIEAEEENIEAAMLVG